jgi:tetratricopeptide (TPR) repeat protein
MAYRRILASLLLGLSLPFSPAAVRADSPRAYSPQDYYLAGFNFYARREYEKSIPYLEAAVRMDPRDWKAYQILGYDYYLTGRPARALEAFELSLDQNPDNPPLFKLAGDLRARIRWENERADRYPPAFRNYDIWVALEGGVLSADLGGLPKAAAAFRNYYSAYDTQASADGFGPLAGLEVGFMLDTQNAWAVAFEGASLNGYRASARDSSGNSLTESLQPDMVALQAEYYHFFRLGTLRLSAGIGAGFYLTVLQLNAVNDGVTYLSGEMSGTGFGGTAQVGLETALGEQFSAGLFLKGRYATTGGIQGNATDGYGTVQSEVLATDADGLLSAFPASSVGQNGVKAVNIDYTGASLSMAFTYHY